MLALNIGGVLLDVVFFQSGSFHHQGSTSSWFSFFTSLTGALIGTATALTVFYLQTRRDRKKDDKVKQEGRSNTLKYFTALLEPILNFAEKQSNSFETHASNIKAHPLEFQLLPMRLATDLKRVLEKFDHEKIFHAYVAKFGNDKSKIKAFQKIFSHLDYLNAIYEQAIVSQEKYRNDLISKSFKYKELGDEDILNYCSLLSNEIKHTVPEYEKNPFWIVLNHSLSEYYKNPQAPKTMQRLQESFIDPLKNELVANFRHVPEAMYIANNCRKATWLLNEIKGKASMDANEFQEYGKSMSKSISELKPLVADLLKEYGGGEG